MVNICSQLEIWAFLALSLVSLGSSLDCYSCERFIDDAHCRDPFSNNVPLAECTESELCVKQKTMPIAVKINSPVMPKFIRGCGPKGYCEKVKYLSEYCLECSGDLCNSAASVLPSLGTALTLIVYFTL